MKPVIWGEEGESVDWKVFFLSLCTIFIAELGDKTQLAVFSLVSQSRTPLAVFLGASLGLGPGDPDWCSVRRRTNEIHSPFICA